MPKGSQANHVKQSHDPNRRLHSHVIQPPNKRTHLLRQKLGRQDNKTKAELARELRQAVENTRG